MALTKVKGSGVEGITNLSNATFLSVNASEVATLLTSAVINSEGGAVTTNIAQGLAKAFVHGDISANVVASQSFNIGSGTDHATGQFSFAITSAMASADYLGLVTCNHTGQRNTIHHATRNTASVLAVAVDDSGSYADAPYNACSLGDLA